MEGLVLSGSPYKEADPGLARDRCRISPPHFLAKWGYRSGSSTAVRARRPCPLWEL